MTELVGQQALVAIGTLLIALGPGLVAVWFFNRRRRAARATRRSPLTTELLRTPGHALREQLEELRLDLASDLALLMFVPVFSLAYLYLHANVMGRMASPFVHAVLFALCVGVVVYLIRSLLRRSASMDNLRLGLDAEMAVGQELDQLMRDGAAVFHDLPAEKFNIDHVVIAPQGVFAVETKGYAKPKRGGGTADATVVFDGKGLAFPDWSTCKPIEQAERQAKWLSDWLSSATGERVRTTPVLALPGWFVDRKGRGDVLVLSGKELRGHLLKARTAQPLSPEQLRRVMHQVEQRCRNVEPEYRPVEP